MSLEPSAILGEEIAPEVEDVITLTFRMSGLPSVTLNVPCFSQYVVVMRATLDSTHTTRPESSVPNAKLGFVAVDCDLSEIGEESHEPESRLLYLIRAPPPSTHTLCRFPLPDATSPGLLAGSKDEAPPLIFSYPSQLVPVFVEYI